MSKENDGGPAFPHLQELMNRNRDYGRDNFVAVTLTGMTLRDWFAGMALQGILQIDELRPARAGEMEHLAMRVYQVADAMIAERQK